MKNLFIIGNGFDIAHGLQTSYGHFRTYLENKYPEADEEDYVLPETYTLPDGGEGFDESEAVGFLIRIISSVVGEDWNQIEEALGRLDFDECFDWLEYDLDKDGDIDPWKQAYLNEDVAHNLVMPTTYITHYFSDWISTIHMGKNVVNKKDFQKLIQSADDLFLSFNYTSTLENVYHIADVCHIHGKQGEELLFGHGGGKDDDEKHMRKYVGAENALQMIKNNLKKDTQGALKKHQRFFESIDGEVEKVYTYGFSFSDVDLIYIKEICQRLTHPNVTWYLNDFDDQTKRDGYMKKLTDYGYQGKISTYHIGG